MPVTIARKTADQTVTSNAFADVSDLTFTLLPNTTYYFRFVVHYTTGSTDAARFSVNASSSATAVRFGAIIPSSTTAANFGSQSTYDTSIFDATASSAFTREAVIEGTVVNGASSSTLALRVKNEVNAGQTITVLTDSLGRLELDTYDVVASDAIDVSSDSITATTIPLTALATDTIAITTSGQVDSIQDELVTTDTVSVGKDVSVVLSDAVALTTDGWAEIPDEIVVTDEVDATIVAAGILDRVVDETALSVSDSLATVSTYDVYLPTPVTTVYF